MPRSLVIDGTTVNDSSDCFVIAEVGHNHQGSVETCRKLFKAAAECGCNAVKLQKRDNRAQYTRAMYDKPYDNENSFGDTYGKHREFLEFDRAKYKEVQAYAKELGLVFFATAFDVPSADFLADLGVPAFKIASGDITNTPLLKHVAKFGKPMIVSTGTGTMDDVRRAHDTIMPLNKQLALLQITATYPTEFEQLNLNCIRTFRDAFPDATVGASLHDNGIAMAVAAYVLGARVVEKHFTLNRAMKGTDHAFSLEPVGMRKMVRDLRRLRGALGDGVKRRLPEEEVAIKKMGKSLYAARALPAGAVLTEKDVAIKVPGGLMHPYLLDRVVGRKLKRAVTEEEPLSPELLDGF